jgi:hypothetical protein
MTGVNADRLEVLPAITRTMGAVSTWAPTGLLV